MSTLTARRQGGRPQPVSEKSITPVSTEAPLARWQETALAPGQAMPVYKCTCGALAPYSAAVMAPSLGATDMLAPRPLAPFPILGAVEAMVAGAQLAPFGFFDAGLLFHRIQRGALLPSPSHPGALQLACRLRNFRHALPGRSFFQRAASQNPARTTPCAILNTSSHQKSSGVQYRLFRNPCRRGRFYSLSKRNS
jgi:hypothetical protein